MGFTIKAVNGVFNLYHDAECTNNVNYPYCKLDEFIQDMQIMCAMIADGPLYASSEFKANKKVINCFILLLGNLFAIED